MLVTVQSVVGSPGVSTLTVAIASHLDGIIWDCDMAGSSLAAWSGRKPESQKAGPEKGWGSLERDWLDRIPDPPLDEHLSEVCKVPLLAGDILPRRMRRLDPTRFARWAHQRSTRQIVADLGRRASLLPADHHVIVARADHPSLWRTWATLLEQDAEKAKQAFWAICAVPSRDDSQTVNSPKALERDWGISDSVIIPWDPRSAKRIGQGHPMRTGALWKRTKPLSDSIIARFS